MTKASAHVLRNLWLRSKEFLPQKGFYFDRPIVLFQSDDWGRVGVRDHEGFQQLRAAGIDLGEHPYDFYSLETAEDLSALCATLNRHRDSSGRPPVIVTNFIVANLDFEKMQQGTNRQIHLQLLADGLPVGWRRPNLLEGYRAGISQGVFYPALHGSTHFCTAAVERNYQSAGDGRDLLRMLWRAGTPYIHWRMPWIGYEYWDPGKPETERFLSLEAQQKLIGQAVGGFAKLFSTLPCSACAPGYRANDDTHAAWAHHGIRIAQNGPGTMRPPQFDGRAMLQLTRTVNFEPATDAQFSVAASLQMAETCFQQGIPAVVSIHSINFHSSVKDFRNRSLQLLDEFLTALERRHSNLLYLHDGDLYDSVTKGSYQTSQRTVPVNVLGRLTKARARRQDL